MELALPSIFTDAEITAWAASIALIVGILQNLSPVPIPEGSRPRAWLVSIGAAVFVGLAAPGSGLEGTNLVLGVILSWAALAAASLGLNRAGTATVKAARSPSPVSGPPGGPVSG